MAKKVFVAMSGGVDSSVAALLLKNQGYDITGITMQIWPSETERDKTCCGLDAISDARRVCWKLDIPHYVLNFREEFTARVVDYFCREYIKGRTPNPCIAVSYTHLAATSLSALCPTAIKPCWAKTAAPFPAASGSGFPLPAPF